MKKISWKTFKHNGVMFPPPYEYKHIPLIYKGQTIELTPEQEEYALIFAHYKLYESNKIFIKNFWKDWSSLFKNTKEKSEKSEKSENTKEKSENKINSIDDCNFSNFYNYLKNIKEKNKKLTKEQKQKIKEKKEKESKPYKIAYIDGKPQPVGNYMIEPPSIFIGRGNHPSIGRIKWRIQPKDITLNLSSNINKEKIIKDFEKQTGIKGQSPIFVSEPASFWLASWKDTITNKTKYVWLSDKSEIKGNKDLLKFETAQKLGSIIKKIRKENIINLSSLDIKKRQLAVVVYLIDYFALRIGNEKGSDEADTVGTVSLRVEHLTLLTENKIKLSFLGKDSVPYENTFIVTESIYLNLEKFIKGKTQNDNIFDQISTTMVNNYLKTFMKKLTARVFRTYNASKIYEAELIAAESGKKKHINPNKGFSGYKIGKTNSSLEKTNLNIEEIIKIINDANIIVAILCNHQKGIGTKSDLKEKIAKLNKDSKTYKEKVKILKEKDKYSHLALGTSKLNYIDPRITIAFLKKHNIPIEKYFNIAQMSKFKWAMDVRNDFIF